MKDPGFVSRGGIKLQTALDQLEVDARDKIALDVGSSTGGFVDCLLQDRAAKVYAVDTAYGQLAWKLRNDPRVVIMERTNILYLESLPEKVDIITIDAGWTKLESVLPAVKKFLKPKGVIIALLKPQYEAPQKTKKGVIPPELVDQVVEVAVSKIEELGFRIEQKIESPILGAGGNKEYLLGLNSK